MAIFPRPEFTKGSILDTSATQQFRLGTIREYYENKYVYCKAGAVALGAGLFCTTAIISATEVEDTVTVAHAAGTRDVTVTANANWTANQFKDGYLWADSGTAIGECYRIESHPAVTSAATGVITLTEPLVTAWSVSDTDISMVASPYSAVVIAPTTAVGEEHVVCIPQGAVTASYYFWGLKEGYGAAQLDVNGQTVGEDADDKCITASANHAGLGLIATPAENATSPDGLQILGYTIGGLDYTDNYAYLCHIML